MTNWARHALRLARAYLSRDPTYLILFVTARCNCRCKMCFARPVSDETARASELSLGEIEKMTRKLRYLPQLTLGGGEPTLRDDLPEIIGAFYRNAGTRYITLPTNGSFPGKTEEIVSRVLRELPQLNLNLSLSVDALEEKHDEIRRLPGVFNNVIETHDRLVSLRKNLPGLSVTINTVLSSYNADCIEDVLKFVGSRLQADAFGFALVRGITREREARDVSADQYRHARHALKHVLTKRAAPVVSSPFPTIQRRLSKAIMGVVERSAAGERPYFHCVAGARLVVVNEVGEVYPCELLPAIMREGGMAQIESCELGRLRDSDYDLLKIVRSKRARAVRKAIRNGRCSCSWECAIYASLLYSPRAWRYLLFAPTERGEQDNRVAHRLDQER